jgi:hypothetical protein
MIAVVNGRPAPRARIGDGVSVRDRGQDRHGASATRATTRAWDNILQSPIERHQVLFEAFAPAEDPRIAVVVALEAGQTGARDAAPIARAMLDAWLALDAEPRDTRRDARRRRRAVTADSRRLRVFGAALLRRVQVDLPLLGALVLLCAIGPRRCSIRASGGNLRRSATRRCASRSAS